MNTEPKNTTITLAFDASETTVLRNLLNIALKAIGTEAAEAVCHFERKIKTASEMPAATTSSINQSGGIVAETVNVNVAPAKE